MIPPWLRPCRPRPWPWPREIEKCGEGPSRMSWVVEGASRLLRPLSIPRCRDKVETGPVIHDCRHLHWCRGRIVALLRLGFQRFRGRGGSVVDVGRSPTSGWLPLSASSRELALFVVKLPPEAFQATASNLRAPLLPSPEDHVSSLSMESLF